MLKRILFLTLCLLMGIVGYAQLEMGQWRTHFSYNNVTCVEQTSNKIYAVADGFLFSVSKMDGTVERYSKLSGLNDADIASIAYSERDETLIIVYENGNIDLMRSGGVENIPDLYNKQMSASKKVNSISFYNNRAYFSCDFGIVVLNVHKNEIADTYFIGPNGSNVKVTSTAVHGGKIYATTESVVYAADATSSNLVNYENWAPVSSLPGSGKVVQVHEFNDKLYLLRNSKLYVMSTSGVWAAVATSYYFTGLDSSDDRLMMYQKAYACQVDMEGVFSEVLRFEATNVYAALYDEVNEKFWFAAGEKAAMQYDVATKTADYFRPNGPMSKYADKLRFAGERLYAVPGGYWTIKSERPGCVMIYEGGEWRNIAQSVVQEYFGVPFRDVCDVIEHPLDPTRFYVAAFGSGIYEFENDIPICRYGIENSPLETIIPSNPNNYIWVDALAFDLDNNLWMTNISVTDGVKVLLNDGSWVSFSNSATDNDKSRLPHLLVSKLVPTQKWIISAYGEEKGVGVFDDNGTLDDALDDKAKLLSTFYDQDGKELKIKTYYTLEEDANGQIWVGTNVGPFVLTNTDKVFEGGVSCMRIKIPRDDGTNAADYLLESEAIKVIVVDGANRKWIGTEGSGVYLMSENGQETIEHFTVENSPLPSNNILSIAINSTTGEVFIGTGSGLVSYQSDASTPQGGLSNIYAYPNPVRETYHGLVTIVGLMEQTTVKITDVTGNVVCETISNGGVAVWDGKDRFGRRVNTGVYLAICLSEDGKERGVTKILFVN